VKQTKSWRSQVEAKLQMTTSILYPNVTLEGYRCSFPWSKAMRSFTIWSGAGGQSSSQTLFAA
jgi:hypothetical protein